MPQEEYGSPVSKAELEAAVQQIAASQRAHDLGQRVGSLIVVGTAAVAIALPVLALVGGLSYRLLRWAAGI